jgi:deazaflavin-dependent oxidoreductase (nitroreductase family)
MAKRIKQPSKPTGISRFLFRMPIWLYQHKIGWMLGGRFLMICHTGRRSGLPRQAVVEVVRHDEDADSYIVAVGFGRKTDWYQNLLANPDASILVGKRSLDVHARQLSPEEGGRELLDYARRHPTLARGLSQFMGIEVDGSDEDYQAAGEMLTFMELSPR